MRFLPPQSTNWTTSWNTGALWALLAVLLLIEAGCASPTESTQYAFSEPTAMALTCRQFEGGDWKPVALETCDGTDTNTLRLLAYVANGPSGDVRLLDLYTGDAVDLDLLIPGNNGIYLGGFVADVAARNLSDRVYAIDSMLSELVSIDPIDNTYTALELLHTPGSISITPDDASLWVTYPGTNQVGVFALDESGGLGEETTMEVGDNPLSVEFGDDGTALITYTTLPFVTRLDWQTLEVLGFIGLTPPCRDGLDNDDDGLIDSQDPGCIDPNDFDETDCVDGEDSVCPELASCGNGIDDDGDGLVDLDDPGCVDRRDSTENSDARACQDGLDNDGDGKVDYPDDPDCASPTGQYEATPSFPESDSPECGNGIDDDGDGLADMDDPDCEKETDIEAPQAQCSNGIDDDGDGLVDYPDDPDCFSAGGSMEAGEPAPMARAAISPDGHYAYVTHRGERAVLVLDLFENKLVDVNSVDDSISRRLLKQTGRYTLDFSSPPSAVTIEARDNNVFAYVTTDSGNTSRIVVESDSEPIHQLEEAVTTDTRQSIAAKPQLFLGDEDIQIGYSAPPGYPNLGPLLVEKISPDSDKRRYYGIEFTDDLRTHRNETWWVEYEGDLPGTDDLWATITSPTHVTIEGGNLCSLGVLPGDWFSIKLDRNTGCDAFKANEEYSYLIKEVNEDSIVLEAGKGEWVTVEGIETVPAPTPGCFPLPVRFEIRPRETFVVSGSRTGFLHNIISTPEGCRADPEGDPLFTGRATMATLAEGAVPEMCPIMASEADIQLATFENPILKFDIFPPCTISPDGTVQIGEPIRDTLWRFEVSSGFLSNTLATGYLPVEQMLHSAQELLYILDLAGRSILSIDLTVFETSTSFY